MGSWVWFRGFEGPVAVFGGGAWFRMLEGPPELGPAPAKAERDPAAGADLGPAAGTEGAKEEADFLGGTYHD